MEGGTLYESLTICTYVILFGQRKDSRGSVYAPHLQVHNWSAKSPDGSEILPTFVDGSIASGEGKYPRETCERGTSMQKGYFDVVSIHKQDLLVADYACESICPDAVLPGST